MLTGCEHDSFPPPPQQDIDTTGINPVDSTKNPPDTSTYIPCDPDSIYFEREILPILSSNCAYSGCHDASTAEDNVILDSYNNTIATAGVRPGMPDKSDLYEVLIESDPDDRMPLNKPPLDNSSIQLIYQWILQGAKNLHCDDCDTSDVSFKNHIQPMVDLYCVSCHGVNNPIGNVSLTNHGQVMIALRDGEMWPRINHEPNYNPMPPSGIKLDSCKIAKIKAWMNSDYPN